MLVFIYLDTLTEKWSVHPPNFQFNGGGQAVPSVTADVVNSRTISG